jgi:hypothetical protein
MHELFPIFGGMVIGGLVLLIRNIPLRIVAFLAGCVLIGVAASWLSGELEESFNFISFDMLEVFLGGVVAVVAITILMRTSLGRNMFNRDNRRQL